jgi:hypothetical protein
MFSADLQDVHEMLKTLGIAVKALQKHVSKANKDIERVRMSCASDCQGLRIEMLRQEKVVSGYMESWSVESAGMTEQVLQLWTLVRTSSSSSAKRAGGEMEVPPVLRVPQAVVNEDFGNKPEAHGYVMAGKAEEEEGGGRGEVGVFGKSVEEDGSVLSAVRASSSV